MRHRLLASTLVGALTLAACSSDSGTTLSQELLESLGEPIEGTVVVIAGS